MPFYIARTRRLSRHHSLGVKRAWLALSLVVVSGCATVLGGAGTRSVTLIDGATGLDNFTMAGGPANWSAVDGTIQATQGGSQASWLLTKQAFGDFVIRVEFWASADANSGIYFRCSNPAQISDTGCYEANIFDQRPDPSYGTASIVHSAKVPPGQYIAGGRWNTYEITAQGNQLKVVFNGVTTADIQDTRLSVAGPIGLQWARGTIRFRKVVVRPL